MADAYTATKDDLGPISAVLAAAFDDDPVISHLLPPGIPQRRRRLTAFMRIGAAMALRRGTLYTTPGWTGGAAWLPPRHWKATPSDMARSMPAATFALGTRVPRGIRTLNVLEGAHPTEPHWYLEAIGTHPDLRGTGLGRALIDPVLEICDRDGVPAYLESSKAANVSYYERFGFTVTGELTLPDDGPTLWPMWRDPRS